jgi:hypothetical protein
MLRKTEWQYSPLLLENILSTVRHHPQSVERLRSAVKKQKDNWGLETLVGVGESWLPAILEQVLFFVGGLPVQ